MNLLKKAVMISFMLLCLGTGVHAFELKVITEDLAPFNYMEGGRVTGFTTEIVRELLEKTEVRIVRNKILLWPWKRAYQAALEEDNVLLFTTTRTPKRENLFKWVGPVYPRQQWMFKLKSRDDITIDNFAAARQYTVVSIEDSANYQNYIKHGFLPGKNLVITNTWDSKVNMFLAGRVDLASFLPLEMAFRMRQLGKQYNLVEKMFLISGEFEYYLAFSRGTPDRIVNAFQKAFDEMKRDGRYDKILMKYLR